MNTERNESTIIIEPIGTHHEYVKDINKNIGYFKENIYRTLGNSDSGHGVMFGDLEPHGQVAIKPFPLITRAFHEKEVLDEIISYPNLDAINPIKVATTGIYVYLVTIYRQGLRHYGQLPWNQDITSRKLKKVISPVLEDIAQITSNLHLSGITHGDMQPKKYFL